MKQKGVHQPLIKLTVENGKAIFANDARVAGS